MKVSEELRQVVALSLAEDMGPVTFKRLLETFGDLPSIFRSAKERAVKDPSLFDKADEEIKKAHDNGAEIITQLDPRYPEALKAIYDPPILLYVKGRLPSEQSPKVAVVGSRLASLYGRRTAETISKGLAAAGAVVVSGMAVGIDSAAHEGALSVDGVTIAVLGSGLSKIYPEQNIKMAELIVKKGAVISEYPMDMLPLPGNFPIRNRIISGLSQAVLVVEARQKSGALITANLALEQGRDVFAVPGNVDSARSEGTNSLLKEGAKIAMSAQDVLEELNVGIWPPTSEPGDGRLRSYQNIDLSEAESKILSLFEREPVHVDAVVEDSGMSTKDAISALSFLEVKGILKQLPGKHYVKADA